MSASHSPPRNRRSQPARYQVPTQTSLFTPRDRKKGARPPTEDDQFCCPPVSIPDEQLRGAVVLAKSVIDAELATYELRDLIQALRRAIDELWQVVKVQGDLLVQLGDKAEERRWLDQRIRRAEREAARLRLPIWFWRPPEEGVSLETALKHRIQWMRTEKYLVDDRFLLVKEYLESINHGTAFGDEDLAELI